MPDEGYSESSKDFVKGCLHKIPMKRPTYAMMLKHPWLSEFSKPETIAEEAEEGEEAEKVADAVGKIDLNSTTEDAEVAAWVKNVLKRKEDGLDKNGPTQPALHAAPLDSVSPIGSPSIGATPTPFS
jgi:mitogen-activated protein kinase kinase